MCFRRLGFLLLLFATLSPAQAVLVDWSALSWTPGSLSNSFDVDAGTAGNDVTVTVSGDTSRLQSAIVGGQQTPAITSNIQGGFGAGHMSLQLAVNFTANTQAITVTIDFSNLYAAGVSNVSFDIFDIDYANSGPNMYQDVIRSIYATSTTGTQIAPTITTAANNTSSGSGIAQVITGLVSTSDTGATSGAGNATIAFNTASIRSITFTYGSSSAFADPSYQHIALDNISFIPESNTLYAGLFGFVLVGMSTLWHRGKGHPAVSRFGSN